MKEVIIMSENNKMKSAASYLLGFITGIFFLATEKKSSSVRFHAMQSTLFFGSIFLLDIIFSHSPLIFLVPLLNLAAFVAWLLLIWKAYSGKDYELPVFGKYARQMLKKI